VALLSGTTDSEDAVTDTGAGEEL
jgi:hypothetical protein